MNVIELERALRQLRLGGMASVLEARLRQAQAEPMAPIDLISCLVSDELTRRSDRLLERRRKQAGFRDPDRTLDNFDFSFNPKMNRSLVFDLATGAFVNKREDALFLGPGGTGKSHLAQAIGQSAIQQGCKVLYRETHILLDELADAVAEGTRKNTWNRWRRFRYSSLTTSACANFRRRPPRIFWKSSCAATNVSARCSHPTARSMTGKSCWVMLPQSALCSIGSCIMAMCSSADPGAGVPKQRHQLGNDYTSALVSSSIPDFCVPFANGTDHQLTKCRIMPALTVIRRLMWHFPRGNAHPVATL